MSFHGQYQPFSKLKPILNFFECKHCLKPDDDNDDDDNNNNNNNNNNDNNNSAINPRQYV